MSFQYCAYFSEHATFPFQLGSESLPVLAGQHNSQHWMVSRTAIVVIFPKDLLVVYFPRLMFLFLFWFLFFFLFCFLFLFLFLSSFPIFYGFAVKLSLSKLLRAKPGKNLRSCTVSTKRLSVFLHSHLRECLELNIGVDYDEDVRVLPFSSYMQLLKRPQVGLL